MALDLFQVYVVNTTLDLLLRVYVVNTAQDLLRVAYVVKTASHIVDNEDKETIRMASGNTVIKIAEINIAVGLFTRMVAKCTNSLALEGC